MKFIRNITLLILLFGWGEMAFAQQDGLYSQYMFDHFIVNPGFAGAKNKASANLIYRNQWAGLDGAPTSQSFSFHTPVEEKNFALGVNMFHDKVGPSNNYGAFATYAYHLRLGNGKLSMALRGGVYGSNYDVTKLDYKETPTQSDESSVNALAPSFDAGLYYYTNNYYIGVASTHLSQRVLGFGDAFEGIAGFQLKRHYLATAGGAIDISESVLFRPSTMVKYVYGAPLNVDLNASFLFKRTLWVGASYRTDKSLVFITEVNITDFLRVGYSYDFGLSQLSDYNGGSQEIFLGADFDLSSTKAISPRFM